MKDEAGNEIIECCAPVGNMATPANTMGMGNISLPTDTTVGSGDIITVDTDNVKSGKFDLKNKLKKKKRLKHLKEYIDEQ